MSRGLVRSGLPSQLLGFLHVFYYYPNPPEASDYPVARGLPSTSPLYRQPDLTIYLARTWIDTLLRCYATCHFSLQSTSLAAQGVQCAWG